MYVGMYACMYVCMCKKKCLHDEKGNYATKMRWYSSDHSIVRPNRFSAHTMFHSVWCFMYLFGWIFCSSWASAHFCLCIFLPEAFLRASVLHTGQKIYKKECWSPALCIYMIQRIAAAVQRENAAFVLGDPGKPAEWSDWLVTLQSVSDFVIILIFVSCCCYVIFPSYFC